MQCRIIILPFCSADSATKRAARRGRQGRGGRERGGMLRTSAWRVREYCSRAYRKTDEQRKQKAGRGVQQAVERVAEVRQAGRARTHIAGWSPFWEVGEFSAKGKVDERTQDGRTTSMSNVHKFMTSLPSRRRVPHGCVCVCVRVGGLLLFRFAVAAAPAAPAARIVCLHCQPQEEARGRGRLPPCRGNGQMLKLIIII